MTNKLVQGQIDRSLDAPNRFVFEPKQKYAGPGLMDNPITRKPENLILLSDTISAQMVKKYEASLADALKEENDYVVYVDCSKRGNKDLMAYILERFIETFVKKEDQEAVVKDIMVRPSPLNNGGRTKWQSRVDNYTGDNFMSDLFSEHARQFTEFCAEKEAEKEGYGEIWRVKNHGFMFFHMGQLMTEYGGRDNGLYIDHPEGVTEFEQRSVNSFIQTRGQIGMSIDKFFNIKINNASDARKMYPPHAGQTISEGHDFYKRCIDEDELMTGKIAD